MNPKIQHVPAPPAPAARVWTTLDLIQWTKAFFEKKGIEQPRLEAELLLAEALGCERIRLYVDFEKPVEAEKLARFREFVRRRSENREPLQYILGHAQFIDLKIKVSPAALIPRPETELLAVWGVEKAQKIEAGARVLELCTGTGCMALYVASMAANATVAATDISAEALALAAENARALKLESRVTFLMGDLFGALDGLAQKEPFDLILANPPYIDQQTEAGLQPEVGRHEPPVALFAADRGLATVRRILTELNGWLKPGGCIGIEFGINQSEEIKAFAEGTGCFDEIHIEKDAARLPRFLFARKSSPAGAEPRT
jgi:release factor glutamine methyltransferase